MTKKNIEAMSLEQVETLANDLLSSLAGWRAAYEKLGNEITNTCDLLQQLNAQRAKFVPLTLETALVTYLETGENVVGYRWLQDKSCKGDWKDTGLRHNGGYWSEINQSILSVWADHRWDDTKLLEQEKVILAALPVIKAGIFGKPTMINISRGSRPQPFTNLASPSGNVRATPTRDLDRRPLASTPRQSY